MLEVMGSIKDNAGFTPRSCNTFNGKAAGDDIQDGTDPGDLGIGRGQTPPLRPCHCEAESISRSNLGGVGIATPRLVGARNDRSIGGFAPNPPRASLLSGM